MGVSGQRASRQQLRFSPGEITPGTHCTGGWVGPTGMDTEATEKSFSLCRGSNLDRPIFEPVVKTELPGSHVLSVANRICTHTHKMSLHLIANPTVVMLRIERQLVSVPEVRTVTLPCEGAL
jgi:hypothetical protein